MQTPIVATPRPLEEIVADLKQAKFEQAQVLAQTEAIIKEAQGKLNELKEQDKALDKTVIALFKELLGDDIPANNELALAE